MSLPLIDLHRHLEGCIRTSTVLDIARTNGDAFAREPQPRDLLVASGQLEGLVPYLTKVDRAAAVLHTLDDWHRVARESIWDAYDDGLSYLELRFSPWFINNETGLEPEDVLDAIADGVQDARRSVPIGVGLIGIIVRDLGPETAEAQMNTLISRKDRLVGVDLAGNEQGFPAALFGPAFDAARANDLHITIHAGEAAGPQSVRDAIEHLHAERIGHGVRSVEDPRLLDYLVDHNITLDVALTSNVQTRAAKSYPEHQIVELMRHGVPVTLNTDDPRASNVTLSHEYEVARSSVGLSEDDLALVARTARTAAFSDDVEGGSIG
ncbi:adenosine deaminase [Curtobacterium sp. MCBA15_001]|uniref:adenosine deaminase n=1 Tax=Curtobacterium sp. MCBA15_001 TaxID=1898731 RepID=UPI0008DE1790|nr:adenosine deaminase [Curtobacterium sp. MCBA15_001]OIH92400.1 adenosine deaminase [Curtobacterium sp. MCBA15_001]